MSSISHYRARAGKAALAIALATAVLASLTPGRLLAADTPSYWFAGTRLIFAKTALVGGETAVSIRDPAFTSFLTRLGATVAWQPGERYVVVTAADRHTISFTLGDSRYLNGAASGRAPFAPYADGQDAYIPFATLARALYVEPVLDGGETVLQPQLGVLDVRQDGVRTFVTLRTATPVRYRRVAESSERVQLALSGVGTTLAPMRQVLTAGLSVVEIATTGNPRNPTTTITFDGAALSAHALYPSSSKNELVLAFAPQSTPLAGTPIPSEGGAPATLAAAPPPSSPALPPPSVLPAPPQPAPPQPAPAQPAPAQPAPAQATLPLATPAPMATTSWLTAVDVTPPGDAQLAGGGATVKLTLNGPAAYEWHRLPDGRWYIDLHAALGSGERDQQLNYPGLASIRVRQISFGAAPVVRVALTLNPLPGGGERSVRIDTTDTTATITVDGAASSDVARSGTGSVGDVTLAAAPLQSPGPPAGWKFGTPAPPPPGSNPRLIVIDPGHGGSDTGAMHNGLVEKVLTLDISQRLRAILVSRGWTVKMTRERDVDVVAPDDDARTELQGRCDIANNAGARLFISVHINSFTSPDLNGTTTYYYKPDSVQFANAIQHDLMSVLGTKDDGVRRDNLYVVRHTTMPAVLVETAFLSNPQDAAKLRNPAFLQNVAQGIADGVRDYAGSPNSTPPMGALSGE